MIKKVILISTSIFMFISVFASEASVNNPYEVGKAIGKVSQKPLKEVVKDFNKKDFLAGVKNQMLDEENTGKIKSQDSYMTGEYAAKEYSSKLGEMSETDKEKFVKGYTAGMRGSSTLSDQEKSILEEIDASDKASQE